MFLFESVPTENTLDLMSKTKALALATFVQCLVVQADQQPSHNILLRDYVIFISYVNMNNTL